MSRNANEAIDSYVGDMLALEEHIAEALGAQMHELSDKHAVLVAEISRCRSMVLDHIQALRKVRKVGEPHVGGMIAGAIKRAGALAAGIGAGAIELLRMERAPKALRDDYTAACLATMGYGMLYATSVALDDEIVGFLAHRHIKDYVKITMTLYRLMPGIVLESLRETGLPVQLDTLPEIGTTLNAVWQRSGETVPQEA